MIAIILAILIAMSCPANGFYGNQAVIVDVESDVVIVEDCDGFLWEFYSSNEYAIGDSVVLLMSDSGTTDTVFDDAVVSCFYLA